MRILVIAILLLVVIVGCQEVQRPKKPEDFIPKDKMEDILFDISVINAARSHNTAKLKMARVEPEEFIYEKYNIDSLQLAENISYYTVDFNKYASLWENVNKRITEERDRVSELKKVEDSIKRLKRINKKDTLKLDEEPLQDEPEYRSLNRDFDRKLKDSIVKRQKR